jgi:hypothetical protein
MNRSLNGSDHNIYIFIIKNSLLYHFSEEKFFPSLQQKQDGEFL